MINIFFITQHQTFFCFFFYLTYFIPLDSNLPNHTDRSGHSVVSAMRSYAVRPVAKPILKNAFFQSFGWIFFSKMFNNNYQSHIGRHLSYRMNCCSHDHHQSSAQWKRLTLQILHCQILDCVSTISLQMLRYKNKGFHTNVVARATVAGLPIWTPCQLYLCSSAHQLCCIACPPCKAKRT